MAKTQFLSRARTRRLVAAGLAAACLTGTGLVSAAPASADPLPVGDLGTAVTNFLVSPDRVAGANDWSCRPSAAHPRPVVLVHATLVNLGANWATISPTLANAGYCVFAFNYGFNPLLSAGRLGGLTDVAGSAAVLRDFVERVRRATGAAQVDLVGHSQGGMMPHYYLKRLGGAAKVNTFVALAPSNHGTTLSGIVTLGRSLNLLGFANTVLTLIGTPGLVQQEAGSRFQRALWADGDTVAGPRYAVIATRHDSVVTPYTNAFLSGPGVTNILVQDQCPADPVGHVGLFMDGPAIQNILNQLGTNTPGFRPVCSGYGLAL